MFDALVAAGQPCSSAEVEARTGLDRNSVKSALRWLFLRGAIAKEGKPRGRMRYFAVPGVQCPQDDDRGRYERTVPHRVLQQALRLARAGKACELAPRPPYRPARNPSNSATVGRAHAHRVTPCLLAEIWRGRKR